MARRRGRRAPAVIRFGAMMKHGSVGWVVRCPYCSGTLPLRAWWHHLFDGCASHLWVEKPKTTSDPEAYSGA